MCLTNQFNDEFLVHRPRILATLGEGVKEVSGVVGDPNDQLGRGRLLLQQRLRELELLDVEGHRDSAEEFFKVS